MTLASLPTNHGFNRRCVERGLKYKYYKAWAHVFDVLRHWYQLLGGTPCNDFLTAVRPLMKGIPFNVK